MFKLNIVHKFNAFKFGTKNISIFFRQNPSAEYYLTELFENALNFIS